MATTLSTRFRLLCLASARHLLLATLAIGPCLSASQALIEFRRDLAFDVGTIDGVAERAYRGHLRALAAANLLDVDTELLDRLRRLVERLRPAAAFERPDAVRTTWEVHTCRRCGENASSMAGGRMLVGEEFIGDLALTDNELGYILAHEMAHVLAEHVREFATTARFFVGNGPNRDYEDIQRELDDSYSVNLRMAPLVIQQEIEADFIGFVLGARAGFDPAGMPQMLRKLNGGSVSALAMHPGERERLLRVNAMLETARRVHEVGLARQ